MYLHEKLEEYGKHGRYPMHMPGHKRQLHGNMYASDITEIEGFDNLHHCEDVLKSDREQAALFYGAGEARFLVNGSTCGVLAAISAVTEYGDSIIIGRNSHKSAYHAIQLRGLRAEYVYPDASLYGEWSIDGPILPEEVRRLLEMSEKACVRQGTQEKTVQKNRAVFLTSPTYEGVISNVREIAEICHEHGVPLIVDEAHGAHLKVMEEYGNTAQSEEKKAGAEERMERKKTVFTKDGGASAVDAGADLVILGLHKTMPVLTQAALLAVSREAIREGRVSMKRLDEYLGIYESSSPSYVLMGSISRCIHWLDGSYEIEGQKIQERVTAYQKLLEETRSRLLSMKHFRLFPGREWMERDTKYEYDPGKIVISTKETGITGQGLADRLREQYKIEIEMASADYIIAMTSMFDTEDGMKSFADAVLACDAALDVESRMDSEKLADARNGKMNPDFNEADVAPDMGKCRNSTAGRADGKDVPEEFPKAQVAMSIAEARSFTEKYPLKVKEKEISSWLGDESGENREEEMSTEFIYVYPPGIPIVAPGEIITKGVAKKIICDYNSGCALIGCVRKEGKPAVRCICICDR